MILTSSVSAAGQVAELSKSSAWQKLNHFHRVDPVTELKRNLELFRNSQADRAQINDDSQLEQKPECQMPARFIFFKKNLPEASSWLMPRCPKWQHFSQGLAAKSVTLVFSSYYLGNPTSAFGHTFLRLNRDDVGHEHQSLLDSGVGFALSATKQNSISYLLGGMLGWNLGEFSVVPYYLKVLEYNNFESRDLWEYDLNLTPEEIELLVAHLWELGHAQIHYSYLNHNCSSLVLAALEAAAPRLNLLGRLPFWVLPAESVKVLYQEPGLVGGFHYRASKRSQSEFALGGLSPGDRKEVTEILETNAAPIVHGDDPARELDTVIDFIDYRYFKELLKGDVDVQRRKQAALVARSQLPAEAGFDQQASIPAQEIPQTSHAPSRLQVGQLISRLGERSLLIGQRFALHDQLDPQQGYPESSEIGFFDFGIRVLKQPSVIEDNQGTIRVDHLYALNLKSYPDLTRLIPTSSWNFRLGAERTWDESCLNCVAGVIGAASGASFSVHKKLIATILLTGDLSTSTEFSSSPVKSRLGPEFNLRAIITPRLVFNINSTYLHLFFAGPPDTYRVTEEIRWTLAEPLAAGLKFQQLPRGDVESSASLYYYY